MKISALFPFWLIVERILEGGAFIIILFAIILWVPFLRVWWWALLPLMLWSHLKTLYIWWIGWDFQYAKIKWVMLEILPPKEVLIPLKAMEDVFTTIWPIWDGANWREIWCDGELADAPYWCSFEIVSVEGKIHFYLRTMAQHRLMIESVLYSHYPEIEIHQVSDYAKNVPTTIPNEEWDMYGEDFLLNREPAYPIKTYEKFFEPQGERISAEEKRMDPIVSLLESMSKLGPGEQYWMQFITMPVNDRDEPEWRKKAESIIAKLSKRPEKKEPTFWEELLHTFGEIIFGPDKEGSGDSAKYEWIPLATTETAEREMVITPGEREIITEVETKIKKPVYRVNMRGVYVAKRENWRSPHRVIARSFFSHFAALNLNYIQFTGDTRPKVHYIMRKRRAFLRARRMMRNAIMRFPPNFPERKKYCAILNSEELATLFHFPLKISGLVAPTVERVESKKAGPPPNLPVE